MVRSRRRGFSPLSTGKLRLWLHGGARTWQDAAMTVPAALDGDVVGGWADGSGLVNDATQATTAAKPVLRVGALNGKNVLEFDGADDHLIRTNTASLEATDMTLMVVANVVDRPIERVLAARYYGGGAPRWRLFVREITYPLSAALGMQYSNAFTRDAAPALDSWHTFTGEYKSDVGAAYIRLDYVDPSYVVVAEGAANQRALYVGATLDGPVPSLFHKGYIAEICYFVPSLTDAERIQMLDYFTAGWGL